MAKAGSIQLPKAGNLFGEASAPMAAAFATPTPKSDLLLPAKTGRKIEVAPKLPQFPQLQPDPRPTCLARHSFQASAGCVRGTIK
jgi:hypothetical protein